MFDGCPFCGRVADLLVIEKVAKAGKSRDDLGLYHHPGCFEAENIKHFTYDVEELAVRRKGGTIERWKVSNSEYFCGVGGLIYNDDRFVNAQIIWTSRIYSINLEDRTLVTKNTIYKLGQPSG